MGRFVHGEAGRSRHSKEYRAWASMIRRCEYPSQYSYPLYGGRGIAVCAEWREDFASFLADIGRAPGAEYTIDRIDPDGHYEPGNVRWALPDEQANNKRVSAKLTFAGREMTVAQWAAEIGVKYQTLWRRVFVQKWSMQDALSARDYRKHPSPLMAAKKET